MHQDTYYRRQALIKQAGKLDSLMNALNAVRKSRVGQRIGGSRAGQSVMRRARGLRDLGVDAWGGAARKARGDVAGLRAKGDKARAAFDDHLKWRDQPNVRKDVHTAPDRMRRVEQRLRDIGSGSMASPNEAAQLESRRKSLENLLRRSEERGPLQRAIFDADVLHDNFLRSKVYPAEAATRAARRTVGRGAAVGGTGLAAGTGAHMGIDAIGQRMVDDSAESMQAAGAKADIAEGARLFRDQQQQKQPAVSPSFLQRIFG